MAKVKPERQEAEPMLGSSQPAAGSGGDAGMLVTPGVSTSRLNKLDLLRPIKQRHRLAILLIVWFFTGIYLYMSRPWGQAQRPYTFVEAVYVMVQIFTTVGYGDYCPIHDGGFLFTAAYVLTAVVVLASVVSEVTEAVISAQDALIQGALSQVSLDVLHDLKQKMVLSQYTNRESPGQVEEGHRGASGTASGTADVAITAPAHRARPIMHPTTAGFVRATVIWSLLVVAGAIFFVNYPGEEKDLAEAIYFSVITLTTVGFGDITPSTTGGRVFAIFWMLLGAGAFANMVGRFAAVCVAQDRLRTLDAKTLLDITQDAFFKKCHPEDHSHAKVNRADFILFMLNQTGSLDNGVVEHLSSNFDDLDTDHSGFLDHADINNYSKRLREQLTR
uniref:Potassium channel domain-containing protein n=1 Tax=Alexandrium monilatum TaxID=311494 RepID=A0A7S4RW65_9DINO|mmetsp:Transcript_69158/g.205824  ORF Transcript_69158/g.205824 Transcript_69158/m.205824 type:complete len:389 (+) Transcript_69158:74-1240(+)